MLSWSFFDLQKTIGSGPQLQGTPEFFFFFSCSAPDGQSYRIINWVQVAHELGKGGDMAGWIKNLDKGRGVTHQPLARDCVIRFLVGNPGAGGYCMSFCRLCETDGFLKGNRETGMLISTPCVWVCPCVVQHQVCHSKWLAATLKKGSRYEPSTGNSDSPSPLQQNRTSCRFFLFSPRLALPLERGGVVYVIYREER